VEKVSGRAVWVKQRGPARPVHHATDTRAEREGSQADRSGIRGPKRKHRSLTERVADGNVNGVLSYVSRSRATSDDPRRSPCPGSVVITVT